MGLQSETSVLLYSADNPDATYLTAALLRHRCPQVGAIATRNLGDAIPGQAVAVALAALGCPHAVWSPVPAEVASHPFDLGITLCVPT